ncbi:SDR family NAD(P)-dependent oxidoreductase [Aliiglaciecola sp. 2_MG-2023]|uniref:SDR family NAD(P)-dependent oxidoreductase n=1 Tax=Alteromonadaceae TaxID=72275 RepID=UPI0026E3A7BB|nr:MULTISPECIES: SDR family NAD(P)-dependent oxidoreductase [unclassified Aliiglaciecola]MDO6709524.1 SDR family NAD(P)-dependent oxidoreductase [Aliiglaciecola sp. 2_MG-2023]MDO6750934.1 SDR family NAD(P)-dependent oxidoreductase [Aliiglaciecola sp. 1_MG-2023]
MQKTNALIIGSSSGIGAELVRRLCHNSHFDVVHAVSRRPDKIEHPKLCTHQLDSVDEVQVENLCKELQAYGQFSLVICCIGVLHADDITGAVRPEKRLEDVTARQLEYYFKVNTLAPMMWLKHLPMLFSKSVHSQVVFLSARVASIEDNKLGGWYGYRASKAALNMLVKTSQVEYKRRFKNVELICYHPGTVDTGLSKPFQSNVPKEKLFSVDFTVQRLLSHLQTLDFNQAPHFIDWDNQPIPW